MKTQTLKTLTIAELFESIQSLGVAEARKLYQSFVGAKISVSGVILKIIKRNENLKLLVQAEMKVFAEFESGFDGKFRKNERVELAGRFQHFGSESVYLNECKINASKETL